MYRLLNHEEMEIRKSAQSLSIKLSEKLTDQGSYKNHYAALEKKPNLQRGAALFMVHCANCHQFGGQGIAVGPPLDGESGRPAESLLADVLNPSAQITAGYSTYIGKLKGGVSHTGVLSSESATSLTLLQAAGSKTQILRSDLIDLSPIKLSLMPSTFSEIMKPEELADVIGHLRNYKNNGALVLFDDDPGFPGMLSKGKGEASLDWKNCASGRACLTVSGFQRYADQLPGWSFSVKENPQRKGQFRYLRLAMKSLDTNGMMIELADNGQFPPNDKPVRTYYVGKNTTGWKSNQLDKEIPTDWKVYTIDLWKNNGDFIITGMAFTTMGGKGHYDRIELLRNDPRELN
jgi:putative heme-binding domain-containing protein